MKTKIALGLVFALLVGFVSPTAFSVISAIAQGASPGSIVQAIQSGTWTMNQGGTWTVQPGNTANSTAWLVRVNENGLSTHRFVSNGTNFADSVTSASTVIYHATCANLDTTAMAVVRIYNKGSGADPDPSVGDLPVAPDIFVPQATSATQPGEITVNFMPDGIGVSNGLGIVVVTGEADTNETPAANRKVFCGFLYRLVS